VEEIPRRVEKPAYFLDTQNDRKPPPILSGIGKIFFHVPALERFAVKKSDSTDALDYCPNSQLPFLQQIGVISPKVIGIYFIEHLTGIGLEVQNDPQIGSDRTRCIVAPHELFAHALQKCSHRELLSL